LTYACIYVGTSTIINATVIQDNALDPIDLQEGTETLSTQPHCIIQSQSHLLNSPAIP